MKDIAMKQTIIRPVYNVTVKKNLGPASAKIRNL